MNDVRHCLLTMIRFGPRLFWLAIGAALCATVLEGAGVITLLPLLQMAQSKAPASGLFGVPIRMLTAVAGATPPLWLILAAFVAAITLRSMMLAAREYLAARLRLGFANELRNRLFDAVCAADWVQIARQRRATLIHALSEDITRIDRGVLSLLLCIATSFL
ncbi:MAG TPA: hypothetical protein VNZ06_07850, partial [Steroidobacteraceae bacterium]|nr:hypothetical protein [Steroidobacteraceae bacterium]